MRDGVLLLGRFGVAGLVNTALACCQPKSVGTGFAPAAFPISGSSHRFLEKIQGETRRPGTFDISARL
jgi:hypothetical protein